MLQGLHVCDGHALARGGEASQGVRGAWRRTPLGELDMERQTGKRHEQGAAVSRRRAGFTSGRVVARPKQGAETL